MTDPKTGEVREAYVFVAVLGASSYTYAEATWTRNLWDWCGSHVRAFEYFQGTSAPDRAGQLEERREKAVLVRAGVEPHL